MVKCVVEGCQNHSEVKAAEKKKRFFPFPADRGRVKVWLAALRENERVSTETCRICEDHFLPEHITESGAIHPLAIPITPPLEHALTAAEHEDLSDPAEVVTEIPEDDDVGENDEDDDDEDDDEEEEESEDDEDDYEEEEEDDNDCIEDGPSCMDDAAERAWLTRLQNTLSNSTEQKRICPRPGFYSRSDVTLGQLTKRFMDLLHSAPEGILDLNEATQKLGTRKRRVYDITNVLDGIKLIRKTSKNKIEWAGPTPINCFKSQWKNKVKADLLNLKTMEEALDWLIKDCAQQLFTLTDLKGHVNSAYVTYEDICGIGAFQDQTVIAIKAPEETKLEVPTPTEDSIKIHLKGCRGPIHVLTCDTEGAVSTPSEPLKKGHFLTLEESRIQTTALITG
ncbi:transcription factor E2F1 [Hoplias malabaricus]|uniref:transcription factor E2F1 n=1 Tax=Hoplias malabaricus TaxID=27720 RepID=UPI003462BB0F